MTAVTTSTRWVGVGRSDAGAARDAAFEAVAAAMTGADTKVVVVYFSDAVDMDELAAGAQQAAGAVPVVGCSTAGEISGAGLSEHGIVAVALGGAGLETAVGWANGVSTRPREAAAEAAECIGRVADSPHRALLVLSDGLAGGQQDVVRGAYDVAGAAVPLVGACAGDDLKMAKTWLLVDGRIVGDAVVAVALGSPTPFGIGVQHGWQPSGEPVVVTTSAGSVVHELDGEPALDVYLRRNGAPAEACEPGDAFNRFAITHPLGIERRSGAEVRLVAGADFEARTLQFLADVPTGGLAWFMHGDEETVMHAVDGACADALAGLGDHRPVGLLVFDCVARRGVIGDEGAQREVSRIGECTGDLPLAGFYSYGEIARTRGVSGFHNQTLVVLALS